METSACQVDKPLTFVYTHFLLYYYRWIEIMERLEINLWARNAPELISEYLNFKKFRGPALGFLARAGITYHQFIGWASPLLENIFLCY